MSSFFQALIMSFREGLEAFLIIVILLQFLGKTGNAHLKKSVWQGLSGGIIFSIFIGSVLFIISSKLGGLDATAKLWESAGSLIAVGLIFTFIVWMINHGSKIKQEIENSAGSNLSRQGIFLLSLFMVAREGVEISVFSFAGKYDLIPVVLGLLLSAVLIILIQYSLVKINLKTLFRLTLAYLVLQSGYLLGYGIHEGLSALKSLSWASKDNLLFTKAFDLSGTVFNHKQGIIGLPLNILLGWYSKPEWIQLSLQYLYTSLLFMYWYKKEKRKSK